MQVFEYQTRIKMRDLDTFGHVNNANYLVLYEEARWSLLKRDPALWAQADLSVEGPVIVDLDLSFKRELCFDDEITITTQHGKIINKYVIELHQEMLKTVDGKVVVCSAMNIRIGVMNMLKRKLVTPPDIWQKILGLD